MKAFFRLSLNDNVSPTYFVVFQPHQMEIPLNLARYFFKAFNSLKVNDN